MIFAAAEGLRGNRTTGPSLAVSPSRNIQLSVPSVSSCLTGMPANAGA